MRDIFECPVSERCLARDNAHRACALGKPAAATAVAAAARERIGSGESMPPALINPADRFMTIRGLISALTQQEDLNFLLTNRIPRAALTRFMGWLSKIEQPMVRDLSIACWRLFSDLDLSEARKTDFKSLHDCFTRELKPGLCPPDPDPSIVVSPCDAIIGAFGAIADSELFQIKGAPYSLLDLRGHPGCQHSAAFSGYRAQCGKPGPDSLSLRCQRPQGRRTRLVRARIDDYRAGARPIRVL